MNDLLLFILYMGIGTIVLKAILGIITSGESRGTTDAPAPTDDK